MGQARSALDLEQGGNADGTEFADAAQIVARQVDDHHVLGAVLRARARARSRSAAVPLIGRVSTATTVDAQEQLRRGRHERHTGQRVAERAHRRVRGGVLARQGREQCDRFGRDVEREATREIDLVALARGQQFVNARDAAPHARRR